MAPVEALDRVVYLLDRTLAATPKVRAFLRAAEVARDQGEERLAELAAAGQLQELDGIGPSTGRVIEEALRGGVPAYLARLEAETVLPLSDAARPYHEALRGDCHTHSTWSDGGASVATMAAAARALGHEYLVLTDHSPRLTIAHGLNRDRLLAQLDEVAALNEAMAPFRILTGMEVDILEDGGLDLDDDLLARLDIVVASAHSKLSMERSAMTRRLVLAAASPHVDILGHCTGRKLARASGDPGAEHPHGGDAEGPPAGHRRVVRAESTFDPEIVFAACAQFDTAVEINCRPERQDPPDELLSLALEWGCRVSIDTDAHAPGQLEWQVHGCEKAARHDIALDRIVNTWSADDLVGWAATHGGG